MKKTDSIRGMFIFALLLFSGFFTHKVNAQAPNCSAPAWDAGQAYIGDTYVVYEGYSYKSKWWTLNSQPDLNSGPYDVWENLGTCASNIAPVVSVINLDPNGLYVKNTSINLQATASDANGSITKVEFYSNGVLLGESTSSPYELNWTPTSAATTTITAKAYDNEGLNTTSDGVTIVVQNSNDLPGISILTPGVNSTHYTNQNTNITVWAHDQDGISKVEFFANGNLIGTDLSEPFSYNWNIDLQGNIQITAKAYDIYNQSTLSAPVPITAYPQQAPTVNIVSPQQYATLSTDQTYPINIEANDNDGSISRIDLYINYQIVASSNGGPSFNYNWVNPPVGDYIMWAVATDNSGLQTESSHRYGTVNSSNSAPEVEITAPVNGSNVYNNSALHYAANATDIDGSITEVKFYLDGQLISTKWEAPFDGNTIMPSVGPHTLKAVAKDNTGATTEHEISFTVVDVDNDPVVNFISHTDNQTIAPGEVTFKVSATDEGGDINFVNFYVDGEFLGTDWTAVYQKDWTATVGTHVIKATAIDDDYNPASVEITIHVEEPVTCNLPAWDPTATYIGGETVSLNGVIYQAKWWATAMNPEQYSGPWDAWEVIGNCGAPMPAQQFHTNSTNTVEQDNPITDWKLYPNPTTGITNLNLQLKENTTTAIQIVSLNGAVVKEYTFNTQQVNQQIDLSKVAKGIYLVKATVNNKTYQKKLIIK